MVLSFMVNSAKLICAQLIIFASLSFASHARPMETPNAVIKATTDSETAFPGAEGYGKYSSGGRGGRIIFVDTLADKGPGSLRACIEASGPRVCIFRVGGVIRFTSERPLIRNPFLTIAGQTAPGGGILITHDGGDTGLTPIAIKRSHNIIIRHVRVRPDKVSVRRGSNDAFTIENSHNVILDHVSGSWAIDENFNGYSNNDSITVSWSIFAEGIPRHDKCALLASDPVGPQSFSFIKNICAHNGDRNPDVNFPAGSCVDVVNNIIYNGKSEFAEIWESFGGSPVNIVGNVFKAGPDTIKNVPAIKRHTFGSSGTAKIYSQDNIIDGLFRTASDVAIEVFSNEPVCPLSVVPLEAAQAYTAVLESAGAFPRDSFDQRIVTEVKTRTGKIVNAPGKLPIIAAGAPPEDLDEDGMADDWERAQGISASEYNPWDDHDGDGWLNLDEYLDAMHQQALQTIDSQ